MVGKNRRRIGARWWLVRVLRATVTLKASKTVCDLAIVGASVAVFDCSMLANDDEKRPIKALAVSIARAEGGLLRLMFDELRLDHALDHSRTWRHETFVTSAVIDESKLNEFSFTSEELEGFAELMLGLLKIALAGRE